MFGKTTPTSRLAMKIPFKSYASEDGSSVSVDYWPPIGTLGNEAHELMASGL
jgi:hypothetical protein